MNRARFGSLISALLLACLLAGGAIAQEEFAGPKLGACVADIAIQCESVKKGGGRIISCLQSKRDVIAAECKAAMFPSDYPNPTEGVSITVNLTGLRSKDGVVFVILSDDPDAFPKGRRTIITPIAGETVSVTFRHLKPGTYALTSFHDENDNGQVDVFSEGVGTSNDTAGLPDFEASAFKVTSDTKLTVALHYL